jgi:hypothetical protein
MKVLTASRIETTEVAVVTLAISFSLMIGEPKFFLWRHQVAHMCLTAKHLN